MRLTFVSLLSCVVFVPTHRASATSYSITDLGLNTTPTSINTGGTVAGTSGQAAFTYDGTKHVLPIPTGFNSANVTRINDNGVLAGWLMVSPASTSTYGFYYDTSYHQLTTGDTTSTVYGINNAGHLAVNAIGGPFISTDGMTMQPIATRFGASAAAYAINNHDQITGSDTASVLFLYTGGAESDIQLPANVPGAVGYALNDNGDIAGDFYDSRLGYMDGFLYSSGAFHNLGDLGVHQGARVSAVSNFDVVVGYSFNLTPSQAAFMYSNGTMTDLNTLIDPASGWTLTNATGINDAGQIVGVGTLNGAQHGFLMTPTPEPSSVALLICAGLFLRRSRRSR